MDNLQWRAMAALIVSLVILLAWEFFLGVPTPPPPSYPQAQVQGPSAQPAPPTVAKVTPSPAGGPQAPGGPHPARDVVVTTPLYRAVFTEQGAKLKSFQLLKFRETVDHNSPPKELVHGSGAELPLGLSLIKPPVDTSGAVYTASSFDIDLRGQQGAGSVRFDLATPSGLKVIKTYQFGRDHYRIDLQVAVQNLSGQEVEAEPSLTMASLPFSTNKDYSREAAVLVGDSVDKTSASKLSEPKVLRGNVRWAAYDEPFFVSAIAPGQNQTVSARLSAAGPVLSESLISPPQRLAPGQQGLYNYSLYYGPKEMKTLEAQGLGLDKLIEYGWFDVIAKPLMVALNWIDGYTGNYGLAIIILTVGIKLIFWPLSQKSYRSMKDMQKIQPKLAKLKETYKNDTAKLNQEMLALYRTYKVNPMGGCLPMVAQIPVFFALYRVLQYSIELRHAPFFGWINDLSAPDRLNIGVPVPYLGGLPVLTLLMGVSMWMQQKMTPTTVDPSQAKMMQLLPVVFTFMFIYFPSGLVLYWLVNNVLTIGQQYYINNYTA